MERWIGPAGWAYDDWKGVVYPRPQPRGFDPLQYLTRYVDLMEVNVTFYRVPPVEIVTRWLERTREAADFRFILKLHQDYSHHPRGIGPEAPDGPMRAAAQVMAEAGRLLTLLLQFPVGFRATRANWEHIQEVRRRFADLPMHLELRHRSWFRPQAYDAMQRLALGLVHLDLPQARDHPPAEHPGCHGLAYYRLHGRNRSTWFDAKAGRDARYDYRYSAAELDGIERRLRSIESSRERSAVVMNNHYRGQALAGALELGARLEGKPVRMPPTLVETYPDLAPLAQREGQQRLF